MHGDPSLSIGVSDMKHSGLRTLTLTIVSLICSMQVMAQSSWQPEAESDGLMPGKVLHNAVCKSNPAAMVFRDTLSRSSVGVSMFCDTQSRPVLVQLGDGNRKFSVMADSYTRLGNSSVVWGDAAFTTGVTRNVKWADCIDYERVAPYVLGDAVGGDLSRREYTFAGGYATVLGKWSVGAYGGYRAEIASRDRDPRLRAVVSDLRIEVGVTRSVSARYMVGLKAGADIYRQNSDLDFYNLLNDINTYPLTGPGTVYRRFSGNSNEGTGYQADGGTVGVQLISASENGFNCCVDYSCERLKQRLRDYNNLTLAHTDHSGVEALLSFCHRFSSSLRIVPAIKVIKDTRRGTENLFGTAIGSGYEVIGKRDNYRQGYTLLSAGLPVEFFRGVARFSVIPSFAGSEISCRVIDVDRRICVRGLTPGLQTRYSGLVSKDVLLQGGLRADYTLNNTPAARNNLMAQLQDITETGLARSVLSNYDMLRADRLSVGAEWGVGKQIRAVLYSIKVNYRYKQYMAQGRCHDLGVAICAVF